MLKETGQDSRINLQPRSFYYLRKEKKRKIKKLKVGCEVDRVEPQYNKHENSLPTPPPLSRRSTDDKKKKKKNRVGKKNNCTATQQRYRLFPLKEIFF